jgi:hypothetical protein
LAVAIACSWDKLFVPEDEPALKERPVPKWDDFAPTLLVEEEVVNEDDRAVRDERAVEVERAVRYVELPERTLLVVRSVRAVRDPADTRLTRGAAGPLVTEEEAEGRGLVAVFGRAATGPGMVEDDSLDLEEEEEVGLGFEAGLGAGACLGLVLVEVRRGAGAGEMARDARSNDGTAALDEGRALDEEEGRALEEDEGRALDEEDGRALEEEEGLVLEDELPSRRDMCWQA